MSETIQFSLFAQEDTEKRLEVALQQIEDLEAQLRNVSHDLVSREVHFDRVQGDYDRLHAEIAMYKRALTAIRWRAEIMRREGLEGGRAAAIVDLCDHPAMAKREVDE